MSVVQAGILGFLRLKMAIEGMGLLTNFGDQAALEQSLEVLRVERLGLGKHELVNEHLNGSASHGFGGWSMICSNGEERDEETKIEMRRNDGSVTGSSAGGSDKAVGRGSGWRSLESRQKCLLSDDVGRTTAKGGKKARPLDVVVLCTREITKRSVARGQGSKA